MTRERLIATTVATLAVFGALLWASSGEPDQEPPQVQPTEAVRLAQLALAGGLTEQQARESMELSDTYTEGSGAADEVHEMIYAYAEALTENELRDYFEHHRDRFGERSFEASAPVIRRIMSLRHTLAEVRGDPAHARNPEGG